QRKAVLEHLIDRLAGGEQEQAHHDGTGDVLGAAGHDHARKAHATVIGRCARRLRDIHEKSAPGT
ncbi:MAG: hypothetical protein JXA30_06805, partial [Deltaproteobacteria bacterium]|nr:hypothetical protein [Deltaproteobacteria bacterium]